MTIVSSCPRHSHASIAHSTLTQSEYHDLTSYTTLNPSDSLVTPQNVHPSTKLPSLGAAFRFPFPASFGLTSSGSTGEEGEDRKQLDGKHDKSERKIFGVDSCGFVVVVVAVVIGGSTLVSSSWTARFGSGLSGGELDSIGDSIEEFMVLIQESEDLRGW